MAKLLTPSSGATTVAYAPMKGLPAIAVLTVTLGLAVTACGGGSIEDQVRSQYGDYAQRHKFDPSTRVVGQVTCTHEATSQFDGWCRVRPKGFHLTYDVPYKGDKVFWGDAGLNKAPPAS